MRCLWLLMELRMIQRAVESASRDQVVVVALLNDIAVLDNQNGICILNGRKSVSNDKTGAPLHQRIHRFLNADLCS